MIEATYLAEDGGLTVFHHGRPYTFSAKIRRIVSKDLAPVLQSLTLANGLAAFAVMEYIPSEDELPVWFQDYLSERHGPSVQRKLEELQAIRVNQQRTRSRANSRLAQQRTLL
jgi:hypothetical protein